MKKQSIKNMNRFKKVLSIFLILLFLNPLYSKVLAQTNILDEGRDIIKNNYVTTVSDYVLGAPDLNEMVKRLNDPYSAYFTMEEYSDFIDSVNNTFCGIGIVIDLIPQGVRLSRVIEDSPAIEAGLKVGDIIVQADDNSLIGISSTEEAIKYIKGEAGSYVNIVVQRDTEILHFNIQRRQINLPTVSSKLLKGKVAYIGISSFGSDTGSLFSSSLLKMEDLGAKSYIIDLRYNGGGYVSTALDIAGHFIGNSIAVTMEDKFGAFYKYKATSTSSTSHKKLISKPIVFLTNEYSASASEILAAAVKDYNKATFIGTTTYGKGVAQQFFPLSDNSLLKLTVNKFYSPLGNVIHNTGVSPDFEVKDDEMDSLKVANLLLSGTSLSQDKSGYMKVNINESEFYIDLKMARSEEYFPTFTYILSKNTIHTNKILQAFSNYTILSDLEKDINVDKYFSVNFNKPVDEDSIKSQGIELMSEITGKRIPLEFDIVSNTVRVTPMEKLEKAQTYYLIVNDNVRDRKGKSISKGTIIKYIVP